MSLKEKLLGDRVLYGGGISFPGIIEIFPEVRDLLLRERKLLATVQLSDMPPSLSSSATTLTIDGASFTYHPAITPVSGQALSASFLPLLHCRDLWDMWHGKDATEQS